MRVFHPMENRYISLLFLEWAVETAATQTKPTCAGFLGFLHL
jgi:hypothetical protein